MNTIICLFNEKSHLPKKTQKTNTPQLNMFPTPIKTNKSVEALPKAEEKIFVTNKPIKTDDDKMSVVIVVPTSETKTRALKEVI